MNPSIGDLTRTFARIGVLSFGGPAAQIALMHRELVDERKWLTESEYLSALSFCMLLPGPEAMQLATYSGWKLHGVRGGLIAGGLFVLPGAVVVLALTMIYAAFGQVPLIAAIFTGVQAAVVAIVIEALLRVARRALKLRAHLVIAALAFVALFFFAVPFPVLILGAGIWGFLSTSPTGVAARSGPLPWGQSLQAVLIWGAIWLVPMAALWIFEGGLLTEIGLFFSKLAVVTFGGAYAVLAWMAQTVVQDKGWLTIRQMMDGLGLAETTPGPLILVTEFVGYMAGHRVGGIPLGLAAAAVTLWMTFAPCFLWIFAGAPWISLLTAAPRLNGALSAITAAVVGVIANLSLWFAAHVFFDRVDTFSWMPVQVIVPRLDSIDLTAAFLAIASAYLLLGRHWSIPKVLGLAAVAAVALASF